MKKFTVIGLKDATGEVVTCVQRADDAHDAMQKTAREILAQGDGDVQIICAIKGDHVTTTPCEDAYKAAYVADLQGEDE